MEIIHSTEIYESLTSKQLKKFWIGHIYKTNTGQFATGSSYWQQKKDGTNSKKQVSEHYFVEQKNVGKTNETSLEEQAYLELESTVKKQQDKGYFKVGELPSAKLDKYPLPMLAKTFDPEKVHLPCYIQPKYDGCRCLSNGEQFWSRKSKLFIEDVVKHLKINTGNVIVDGELLLPAENGGFQDSIRAIKKFVPESRNLEYVVYDIIDPNMKFEDRYLKLKTLVEKANNPKVKLAPTLVCSSKEDISCNHATFVGYGFEGSIVRKPDSLYKIAHRSDGILKVKDFIDEEFEIVFVTDGEGKERGLAIFSCKTRGGETFSVRPIGTAEERSAMFVEQERYMGKMLKVKFQNWTDDGIPRFPVGLGLREEVEG